MNFLAALGFLTVLPVGRRAGPAQLGRSLPYFPVVGLFLGLVLAGLDWLLGRAALPLGVVNALLIAALALLTGALHLDGLMDTCDGLGGMKTPQERWQVMKDSRVGAFGVLGLALVLLVKYAALGSLPRRSYALALMPVLGRWAGALAIFAFPYAKPQGLGRAFKEQATASHFAVGTLIALAISLALFRGPGLIYLAATGVLALALGRFFRGRFSGLTGDCYGAIIEVSEVFALLLLGVRLPG